MYVHRQSMQFCHMNLRHSKAGLKRLPARVMREASQSQQDSMRILFTALSLVRLQRRKMSDISGSLADVQACIQSIHAQSPRPAISLLLTGGGMQVVPLFLCTPGASSTILSADVPYARAASEKVIVDYTGTKEGGVSTSREKAFQLAKAAYNKGVETFLQDKWSDIPGSLNEYSTIIGVGCTAALVSAVPKKGDHRCHVAIYSNTHVDTFSIKMAKGLRDRLSEDMLCSTLIVDAVMQHLNLPLRPTSLLHSAIPAASAPTPSVEEQVITTSARHEDALEALYQRRIAHALFVSRSSGADGSQWILPNATIPPGSLVYPGSFNPLHEGHISLVKAALVHLERAFYARGSGNGDGNSPRKEQFQPPLVVFEIGAVNADKPPLPREEIERRLAQFDVQKNPLLAASGLTNIAVSITAAPLFVQKSDLFTGCSFVIGADTLVRLVNGKYYQDKADGAGGEGASANSAALVEQRGVTNMVAALTHIADNECSFIVGGRVPQQPGQVSAASAGAVGYQTCEGILNTSYAEVTGAGHSGSTPLTTSGSASSASTTTSSTTTVTTSTTTITTTTSEGGGTSSSTTTTAPISYTLCTAGPTVAQVLPRTVTSMFHSLSEEEFRLDLSSTELRRRVQEEQQQQVEGGQK